MTELERLRLLETRVKRWAALHELHHLATTIEHKGPERYVPRAEYLAAERALLEAVRGG